ncbi:MAG: hypothetical protein H0V34_00255 [Gammaproteobacteria bacterium]|nr:hypothetical protein [Gammaproteobacteria bacterium]
MNADRIDQRREGARLIAERCRQLAREFDVDLKSIDWKESLDDEAASTFTLILGIESESDEIQLADSELRSYAGGKNTDGTDAKLETALNKRY